MKKYIVKNYYDKDVKKVLKLRKKINNKFKKFLYLNKYNKILYKNNSFIPLKCTILDGVVFPHGLCGIFISQGAKIGSNCTIFHHVTIGSNTFNDSKTFGSPTIGNNVFIGAGAKIIGNVKIGDNVRIGAGCIITIDIPDNCTVVMSKPNIIKHKTKKYTKFVSYK